MGKAHAVDDREHLQQYSTKKLEQLRDKARRSIEELTEYFNAIDDVLHQRAREEAGDDVDHG